MGSLEIALLGMACAIFFGALIALVTICSIKYKRYGITFCLMKTICETLPSAEQGIAEGLPRPAGHPAAVLPDGNGLERRPRAQPRRAGRLRRPPALHPAPRRPAPPEHQVAPLLQCPPRTPRAPSPPWSAAAAAPAAPPSRVIRGHLRHVPRRPWRRGREVSLLELAL